MPLLDYLPVVVLGATGAIGYGELRQRVNSLSRDVETKASREVVDAHYGEIIRRLDRIENRVNHREET
jgi:hypothetical protein